MANSPVQVAGPPFRTKLLKASDCVDSLQSLLSDLSAEYDAAWQEGVRHEPPAVEATKSRASTGFQVESIPELFDGYDSTQTQSILRRNTPITQSAQNALITIHHHPSGGLWTTHQSSEDFQLLRGFPSTNSTTRIQSRGSFKGAPTDGAGSSARHAPMCTPHPSYASSFARPALEVSVSGEMQQLPASPAGQRPRPPSLRDEVIRRPSAGVSNDRHSMVSMVSDANSGHSGLDGTIRPHPVFLSAMAVRTPNRKGLQRKPASELESVEYSMQNELSLIAGQRSVGYSNLWLAAHPDSVGMTIWGALGALGMLWDCWSIPWSVSIYRIDEDLSYYYWSYVPRLYWTFNIFVQFMTAYYTVDHRLERHYARVAWRYLKSWFAIDALLVLVDWMSAWYARPSGEEYRKVLGKCAIAVVGLRVFRHARKLPEITEKFQMLRSRHGFRGGDSTLSKILGILVILLLFNHAVCCFWYGIGDMEERRGGELGWMKILPDSEREFRRYLYVSALHWSMTQFFPGSMEVVPTTFPERVFNVVVLVIGWVVVVTSTAILTSLMTQKRLRIEQTHMRRMQLLNYLFQEKVEHALAVRVRRHAKATALRQASVPLKPEDVHDLQMLPNNLRKELAVAIHGAQLRTNDFYAIVQALDPLAFVSICSGAVQIKHFRADDVVFEEGQRGDCMRFVKSGVLKYVPGSRALEVNASMGPNTDDRLRRGRGTYCSEASLWCDWVYLGTMTSVESSELQLVHAESLISSLKLHPEMLLLTCDFCVSVCRQYQVEGEEHAFCSDLELITDHADVASGMLREVRTLIADSLLDMMQSRAHDPWAPAPKFAHHFGKKHAALLGNSFSKLREEISEGTCFVWLHQEEIFRIVSVVALRVRRRHDSRFLAKIGEVGEDGKVVKAAIELPGAKRKEQEVAIEAAHRIIAQSLPQLAEILAIQQEGCEHSATTQQSDTYGIRSRYLKTTFNLHIEDGEILPTTPASTQSLKGAGGISRSSTVSKHSSFRSAGSKRGIPACGCCRRQTRQQRQSFRGFVDMKASFSMTEAYAQVTCADVLDFVTLPGRRGGHQFYVWVTDIEYDALQPLKGSPILFQFLETFRNGGLASPGIISHHQSSISARGTAAVETSIQAGQVVSSI